VNLDDLAHHYGTDKGSRVRGNDPRTPKGYAVIYQQLLAPRRNHRLSLLEIGVSKGASLRMWADWLPQASIVGVDINPACRRHTSDRSTVHIGDQADPDLMTAVAETCGPFDVVIDDGGHHTNLHQASFTVIWPHVNPGGFYAIEDLRASPASIPWLESLPANVSFPTPQLAVVHA
jgi:cephalosporin hydroxylase